MAILHARSDGQIGSFGVAAWSIAAFWTMKYYEKTGSQVTLRAANKKYKPIIPRDELKIGGVIVAVIRKYR
jgi:SOS-response transcriptional repressor LexA